MDQKMEEALGEAKAAVFGISLSPREFREKTH
jgi:hypothetical protein